MKYEILEKINSPDDLKALSGKDIYLLLSQIRAFLINNVERTGGHLASNLGVAELTVAIHRVFNSPSDHIIFDVGHQAYVHKLLTGRRDEFVNLRRPGGLSGFTVMRESRHDAFGAGHSSTSLSAALGYAEGDKLEGKDDYTVCVIGDGAYTGGMIHEALNNCNPDLRMIIILNENGMSISSNKGAFATYLSKFRMSRAYRGIKRITGDILSKIPLVGKHLLRFVSWVKRTLARAIFRRNYFEELGLYYIGPIDGNDYAKVEKALSEAKALKGSVVVHLKTTKGKGFDEAERAPESFHNVALAHSAADSFHSVFARELIRLAEADSGVVGVTAAMGIGTGLTEFGEKFPDKYFDVGIAEEHAMTFSAGLAARGLKPYVAIYSTFLQRAYDNVIHDVALQGLPVRMIIDRAGIAVSDGATHHGIFDVAFLSHIPGVEIYAPSSYDSLSDIMSYSLSATAPMAIRFSNSSESERIKPDFSGIPMLYKADFDLTDPPKNVIVTYGNIVKKAIEAKDLLVSRGIDVGILVLEKIKPYTDACDVIASLIKEGTHLLYVEEGIKNGGAAMLTREYLCAGRDLPPYTFDIAAIDDSFLVPTELCDIYELAGLSPQKIASYFLNEGGNI